MIYKFLFPSNPNSTGASLFLLILRVFFGLLLMNHGIQKWSNFQELSAAFPDPLGVGSPLSLGWPFLENWYVLWPLSWGCSIVWRCCR